VQKAYEVLMRLGDKGRRNGDKEIRDKGNVV
jgi:hypothetical protein